MRAPEGARGQGAYVDGPRRNFAGGAGLLSTARDYARFLEAMRRGGSIDGTRILSPRSVKLMSTNQVGDAVFDDRPGLGTGLRNRRSLRRKRHEQRGRVRVGRRLRLGYRVDPEARLVMVLMIQLDAERNGHPRGVSDAGLSGAALIVQPT